MTKEQKKEYWKKWYAENKEVVLAKQKIRSQKNYQENKEKYKLRAKLYRENNQGKIRELQGHYREKNRELLKARSSEWYRNNKEKASIQARKQKLASYGMTPASYDVMSKKQNNVCAICGEFQPMKGKQTLHVDHCHNTKKVRGLLCHHCNVGLGAFKDKIELLKKAMDYLTKS